MVDMSKPQKFSVSVRDKDGRRGDHIIVTAPSRENAAEQAVKIVGAHWSAECWVVPCK